MKLCATRHHKNLFFSVTNNDRDIQVYLSLCVTNATLTLRAGKEKKTA